MLGLNLNSVAEILVVTAIPSMIISAIVLFPVRRYANKLGLVARPGGHSTHVNPTPLGGGIGIWAGIVTTFGVGTIVVLLLPDQFDKATSSNLLYDRLPTLSPGQLNAIRSRIASLWSLLGLASVLFALGIWDDRRGVTPRLRLLVEFAVAAITVYGLGFGLTAYISLAWLTKLLSVLWIVGLINSFNMLDNMDGLSGGVAAIIALAMAVVMATVPDPRTGAPQILVAALLLVVFGSLLGFLFHNRPPARIFMGDGGSYLVGYLIATSMLMATYAGNAATRPHAVLAPLCVMAVPLYDMITVLWIRLRERRSIFVGDRSHFSHRLVDLGLSRTQAVLTIYLLTATCGLAAILLSKVDLLAAAMVLGIVACMLLLVIILESTGWGDND
ncbi:MAG: MraY family glycosyltransferase [Planctomycetota bacterium]